MNERIVPGHPSPRHRALHGIIIGLTCAAIIAGCLDRGQADDERADLTDGTSDARAMLPLTSRSENITFSDCRGLGTHFFSPLNVGPGDRPPSWGPGLPTATQVSLDILECNSVEIGPFVGGHLHVIFETHDNFQSTRGCFSDKNDDFDQMQMLQSLWTDNAAVADYLARQFEMPIVLGNITLANTTTQGIPTQLWSWNAPGQEVSELSLPSNPVTSGDEQIILRLVWPRHSGSGTGIGYLDLDVREHFGSYDDRVATGHQSPPMLHARMGVASYAGYGTSLTEAQYGGNFFLFTDPNCAHQEFP